MTEAPVAPVCSLKFFVEFLVRINSYATIKWMEVKYGIDETRISIRLEVRGQAHLVEKALVDAADITGHHRVRDSDFKSPGSHEFLAPDYMMLAIVTTTPEMEEKVELLIKKYTF